MKIASDFERKLEIAEINTISTDALPVSPTELGSRMDLEFLALMLNYGTAALLGGIRVFICIRKSGPE